MMSDTPPSSAFERNHPKRPIYAATVPSSAPRKARPPAVTAVRLRRVRELAPAAVSVRSSLAVSLRMSPTLMARTPRARAMPKTVAQLTISDDVGASFFDSMLRSPAAASELALVSWAGVIGAVGQDRPAPEAVLAREVEPAQRALGDHRVRRRRADGQLALLLDDRVGQALVGRALVVVVAAGAKALEAAAPLAVAAEGQLHARAGQSRPRAEDVDVGRDRRGVDAVGPQEGGRGHVDRVRSTAGPLALGFCRPTDGLTSSTTSRARRPRRRWRARSPPAPRRSGVSVPSASAARSAPARRARSRPAAGCTR